MAIFDNESPPGSWAREMEKIPWRFSQQAKVEDALVTMRMRGMHLEASIIAQEINVMKAEIERLKNKDEK